MIQPAYIHDLLAFALAALFIVLVPGPNMTYLISCSASQGKKTAIFALLGSNSALIVLGVLTGLGLNSLLQAVPNIYYGLKIIGAFYFFWLAWKTVRNGKKTENDEIKINKISPLRAYQTGFLTNVLNPKAVVFYIAIFPQFLIPSLGHLVLQGTGLALIHALVSFIVNSTIIFSVNCLAVFFHKSERIKTISRWGIATIFSAFAVRILVK